MENFETGILISKKDIKLRRQWFKEMCKMIGINVIYKAPRKDKTYNLHGELETHYSEPIVVGCIFDEHPTQATMKRMGWTSELLESNCIIHLPDDLPDLQIGALITVPTGLDSTIGRLFKVVKMTTISVYPTSIACEIGPVFESDTEASSVRDYTKTTNNLLKDNEEDD